MEQQADLKKKTLGLTALECVALLRYFVKLIDSIADLFDRNTSKISGENADLAARLFKGFKLDLESEYRIRSSVKSENKLSVFEEAFVEPSIHQAYAELRLKINSRPNGERWLSELCYTRVTLNHSLLELKKVIENPDEYPNFRK